MRKFLFSLVFLFASSLQAAPINSELALSPQLKSVTSLALYGAVGGALLGTASLAFDAEGRWVAKGASLGLYAGLGFGVFIVLSYALGKDGGYETVLPPSSSERGGGGDLFQWGSPSDSILGSQLRHPSPKLDFFVPLFSTSF